MDKNVNAPRLIYGLLSEAEARGAIVFCRTTEAEDRAVTSQLTLVQGASFKDATVSLSGVSDTHVECEVVLFGRRLIFELHSDSPEGMRQYSLPTSIQLLDLRRSPRIDLSNETYPAEIRFTGGIILGAAQDVSRDHVSVSFSTDSVPLLPKLKNGFEIVIRSRIGEDIYHAKNARIVHDVTRECARHMVFQWEGLPALISGRKAKRHSTGPASISFSCGEIREPQISGRIELIEASLTGFSGVIRVKNSNQQPPLGLLLKSEIPNIVFSATRKQGDVYGFVILSGNQEASLKSWVSFVDQFRNTSNSQIASTHELAALLMESGFLKSNRLQRYGSQPEVHLANVLNSDPLLARRYAHSSDGNHVSESLSLFRLTEYAWLLHEVAAGIHGSGGINALYESVISSLKDESISSGKHPRWLCVYYNPHLSVVARQWDAFSKRGVSHYFPTRLISLSKLAKVDRQTSTLKSTAMSLIERSEKVAISSCFPEIVLELVDYWTTGVPNLQLLTLLQGRGPSHEVMTEIVHSKDSYSNVVACCHRVKTHYSVNSTGVLNSLWVFLKTGITQEEFQSMLGHLGDSLKICTGTDDVILVFANASDSNRCMSEDGREFRLLITSLRDLDKNEN